jgi:spermidine/putrescine transport system substrate-binding protein
MTTAPPPGLGAVNRRNFLKLAFGATAAAAALARPRPLARDSAELRLGTWAGTGGIDGLRDYEALRGQPVAPTAHASNEAILDALRAGDDYDVVVLTAYAVAEGVSQGLLQPMDRARVPNFDMLPEEFRDGRRAHDPEDAFSAPKAWGTTGILYRADLVATPPVSWGDFWAAAQQHPGKVYVIDSAPEVVCAALYKLGYPPLESAPEHLEQARAELLALRPCLGGFDSDIAARLGSGDAALALGWSTDAERLLAAGLPVGFVIPVEGSELWEDDYCIPAKAGDPAAAHEFINYMLGAAPPSLPPQDLPYSRLFAHTPLEPEAARLHAQIWQDVRVG